MNIQNKPQLTFQGGFRLKNVSAETAEQIPNIAKRGKQIFNNFEHDGDVFVVLRNELDKKMAAFVHENKLDFEYYKDINTKCHLDSEIPELLSQLIADIKEAPVTTHSQLKKIIREHKRIQTIETNSPNYTDNILKTLCIDNKFPVNSKKGAKIINDNEFKRKIYISPPSKEKIHYVIVQPESISQSAERYAIDSLGKIIERFNTPEKIKEFAKKFNAQLIKIS